jgi:uncharacterized membrane protein
VLPATSVAGQGIRQYQLSRLLEKLEALAPLLLAALIVLWIAIIFAASVYKYETFGQGYDQVDFEQAIWNTTQGRVMQDSRFDFTGSIFGMDWMPMLLFFVPVYALVPSAHALFFLQIVASALGAVPVYWLARDRLGSKVAGTCFGAVYLLYPTLLHTALNPFQVRLFALTLLLFGFYYFEKSKWQLFGACVMLAMLARTDVALVVAMFGLYGLLTRRKWPYVIAPLALGLGYFALSTFVIVPSFLHPAAFSAAGDGSMQCWPCGSNPILAYYGHLGRSGPEIIGYILTHPIEVAQLMFTGPKLWYMLTLLAPLAFLPLLAPRPLVLGLPILALNLMSLRSAQFDYEHHYSLLIIPGLMASAIYGVDALRKMWAGRAERHGQAGIGLTSVQIGAVALVVWGLAMQVPYKNPAVSAFLYPEPPARVVAAHELIGMVPQEAKVAVSSKLAPHLLPRRYIYNFPPAAYSPYNFGPRRNEHYTELDYILVDPEASALKEEENKIGGKSGLEWLAQLPEWERVSEREGLLLFRRR